MSIKRVESIAEKQEKEKAQQRNAELENEIKRLKEQLANNNNSNSSISMWKTDDHQNDDDDDVTQCKDEGDGFVEIPL